MYKEFKNIFPSLDFETFEAYKDDNKNENGRINWYGLYLQLERKYNC